MSRSMSSSRGGSRSRGSRGRVSSSSRSSISSGGAAGKATYAWSLCAHRLRQCTGWTTAWMPRPAIATNRGERR